jgi:glycosyltransferase involved in cell wall biosynthesis
LDWSQYRMNNNKKVLHICNWYPNKMDELEGIFIKTQIDTLHPFIYSEVMHIQVKQGQFKFLGGETSIREKYWILVVPIKSFVMIELLSSALLFAFFILKYNSKKYSLINFHIAHPLLTYFGFYKSFIQVPVVINEHWSAYRFNFGIKKEIKKIKKIFFRYNNVITVSKSLANDIRSFSGNSSLNTFILPNALDTLFFKAKLEKLQHINKSNRFLMLSEWKEPKDPFVIVNSFSLLQKNNFDFILHIGGYGNYIEELKDLVMKLGLSDQIKFLGKLNAEQIIDELSNAGYFLHASQYETFSVVCLEALSQGVPVVASNVGGIPDFVNESNGILVDDNKVEEWRLAIESITKRNFNRLEIATRIRSKYSAENIGRRYSEILNSFIENTSYAKQGF